MSLTDFLIEPHQIPAMPHVLVKALAIIKDEESGMKELGQIISYDQALTTQVLKLVNSAYYGFSQQITSIDRALTLIGVRQARNIILTVGMKSMLSSSGGKYLWEHSIKCGVACEKIAKDYKIMSPDEAFMIGFLHDIGKILLHKKNPLSYGKTTELIKRGLDTLEAEQIFFKTNHSEVGFFLASQWKLSIIIANAIKYHHCPLKSSMINVASLVYFADVLVQDNDKKITFDKEIEKKSGILILDPLEYRRDILDKSRFLLSQLIN